MNSRTLRKIEEYKREQLCILYHQLSVEERDLFVKLHGKLDDVKAEKLDLAIFQCDNTLEKKTKPEA